MTTETNTPSKVKTQTFNTSLGHKITVFKNDHIGRKIELNGLYEKENLSLLNALIKKLNDPVVLDIGANIGNHALAFSTVAKVVYAFEPLPEVFDLLKINVAQNKINNIQINNFALSDNAEEATIFMVQEGNVGASSFDKREQNVKPVTVKKQIGDDFIATNKINRVDFIKIDVEAHEVYVLRGLMSTLQQYKPIITMEWNDPLTIERLRGSEELKFLFQEYDVHVLGSNYDRGYWLGQPFAFIRRKLTRFFVRRSAVLYPFNPDLLYKNLLLIPKHKSKILINLEQ